MSLMLATAVAATLSFGAGARDTAFLGNTDSGLLQMNETPAATYADEAAPALAETDERFLREAAQDNLAAIDALNLLAAEASDASLRDLARQMADLRYGLQDDLEVLAIRKDVVLSRHTTAAAQAALAQMAELAALAQANPQDTRRFDQAWLQRYGRLTQQSTAHWTAAARQARNGEVKAFARMAAQRLRDSGSLTGLVATRSSASSMTVSASAPGSAPSSASGSAPGSTQPRCESPIASNLTASTGLRLRCAR